MTIHALLLKESMCYMVYYLIDRVGFSDGKKDMLGFELVTHTLESS